MDNIHCVSCIGAVELPPRVTYYYGTLSLWDIKLSELLIMTTKKLTSRPKLEAALNPSALPSESELAALLLDPPSELELSRALFLDEIHF